MWTFSAKRICLITLSTSKICCHFCPWYLANAWLTTDDEDDDDDDAVVGDVSRLSDCVFNCLLFAFIADVVLDEAEEDFGILSWFLAIPLGSGIIPGDDVLMQQFNISCIFRSELQPLGFLQRNVWPSRWKEEMFKIWKMVARRNETISNRNIDLYIIIFNGQKLCNKNKFMCAGTIQFLYGFYWI